VLPQASLAAIGGLLLRGGEGKGREGKEDPISVG